LGQDVVNKQQIRELTEVINLIDDELLSDRKKKYYLTLDRLDEKWVHDPLRYRLIRALIETVRDFNSRVENVKITVAIREDLLDRVFRATRQSGDQQEKYRSLYLNLSWKSPSLRQVIECRVAQLITHVYSGSVIVTPKDILPNQVMKK